MYSCPERLFSLDHHFAPKLFAVVRRSCSNVHSEVPNKTTIHGLLLQLRDIGCVSLQVLT
jgi:hypothetical protein